MAKKPDIELVALTKRFGEAVAVDSANLKIPAGSCCRLPGPARQTFRLTYNVGSDSVEEHAQEPEPL